MAPPRPSPIRSSLAARDPFPRHLCIPAGGRASLYSLLCSRPSIIHPLLFTLTTQTREAIRRGLRVRHSDDRIRTSRGMSNNIRMATVTDDEAAARNSLAHFVFSSPPSCGWGRATCYCAPTHPPTAHRPSPTLVSRHRSYVSTEYQPHFHRTVHAQARSLPLSLIGFPRPRSYQ